MTERLCGHDSAGRNDPATQQATLRGMGRGDHVGSSADGRLHLVSCVSTKVDHRARAKDLYVSPWFRKARAYVSSRGAPWKILSAKHGLLSPESLIEPYEAALNTLPVAKRRAWSDRVLEALDSTIADGDEVVMLAGLRYREFVVPALRERGVRVDVPMSGLGLGMQLRWFDNQSRSTDG